MPTTYLNFSYITKENPHVVRETEPSARRGCVVKYVENNGIVDVDGPPIYDVWHENRIEQQTALMLFWKNVDGHGTIRGKMIREEPLFLEELRIAIQYYQAAYRRQDAFTRSDLLCKRTHFYYDNARMDLASPNIYSMMEAYVLPSYSTLDIYQDHILVPQLLERLIRLHNNIREYCDAIKIVYPTGMSKPALHMWKLSKTYITTRNEGGSELRGFSMQQLASIVGHLWRNKLSWNLEVFEDAYKYLAGGIHSLMLDCIRESNDGLFSIFVDVIVKITPRFYIQDRDLQTLVFQGRIATLDSSKQDKFYNILSGLVGGEQTVTNWTPRMFYHLHDHLPVDMEDEDDDEGEVYYRPGNPTPISSESDSDVE